MHHNYMVRDEKAVWTGLKLVGLLLDPAGERAGIIDHGERSPRIPDRLRGTLAKHKVERSGFGDQPIPWGGEATVRAWFTPVTAKALAQRISSSSVRPAADPDRLAGPDFRPDPQHPGRDREPARTRTSPGCSTNHRRTASMNMGDHRLKVEDSAAHPGGGTIPFSGKRSVPYGTGTVRDFMHAKVTVADDTVFFGSFNLSRSRRQHRQNMVEIEDPGIAEKMGEIHRRDQGALPPQRARTGAARKGERT